MAQGFFAQFNQCAPEGAASTPLSSYTNNLIDACLGRFGARLEAASIPFLDSF